MEEIADREIANELRDSVSRIVENIGFSSIDSLALSKLTDLLYRKLYSMGTGLRNIMENSDRHPSSANDHDVLHLFRQQKINISEIVDYMNQVIPFPPPEKEQFLPVPDDDVEFRKIVAVTATEPAVQVQKNQKEKLSIPKFDNMDEYELGISEMKKPSYHLDIRALPGFIPSKLKNSTLTRIEQDFNTNYYVPVGRPAKASKSTPEIAGIRAMYETPIKVTQVVQRPYKTPLPSQRQRMSLLQKKIYQKNHERRLREEMNEIEEKRAQATKKRLSDENRVDSGKKKLLTKKAIIDRPNSRSKENELKYGPLLKMNLTYSRFDGGAVIKKASTTRYRLVSGSWKPMKRNTRIKGEVVSYEVPRIDPKKPPIPKIVIRRQPDGSIVKI